MHRHGKVYSIHVLHNITMWTITSFYMTGVRPCTQIPNPGNVALVVHKVHLDHQQ